VTSPTGTLQIDTTPPAAPVIASDTVNANNTVTLTGTAAANSTLTVYDGQTALGKTTANANGAWSYTTTTLASGTQAFTVTATDAAGNVSAASNSVDPSITLSSPGSTLRHQRGARGEHASAGSTDAVSHDVTGAALTATVETVASAAPVVASDTISHASVSPGGAAEGNITAGVVDNVQSAPGTATANGTGASSDHTARLASDVQGLTAMGSAGDTGIVSGAIDSAVSTDGGNTGASVYGAHNAPGAATADSSRPWSYHTGTLAGDIQGLTAKGSAGESAVRDAAIEATQKVTADPHPAIGSPINLPSSHSGTMGEATLGDIAAALAAIERYDGGAHLMTGQPGNVFVARGTSADVFTSNFDAEMTNNASHPLHVQTDVHVSDAGMISEQAGENSWLGHHLHSHIFHIA
jgi:hypothetical protein